MNYKYTLSKLREISKNPKLLEDEVELSYGRVLTLMEKNKIYPALDDLLAMKKLLALPFILNNYFLDDSQLQAIKEKYNRNDLNKKNVIKINEAPQEISLDKFPIQDLNLEATSPEDVIKYIKNNLDFSLTDLHDYDFFEKVMNSGDFNAEDINLESFCHFKGLFTFFIHCSVVSLEKGINPRVDNKFVKFVDILTAYDYMSQVKPIFQNFIKSDFFIECKIKSFGETATILSNGNIPCEVIKYGISKPLVLNSLQKVFRRTLKSNHFDDSMKSFIFSIGYLDAFGRLSKSSVSDYLSDLDKNILRDTFDNMVPFSWEKDTIETPFVSGLIDIYLFDDGNFNLLDLSFKFPYRDENYDLVFSDKRIKKIALTLQKSLRKRSNMNFLLPDFKLEEEEFFIAKTYLKVFKYVAENNISLFKDNDLAIPFNFLFFLNVFKKETPLLDIIKDTPNFFKFEYGKNLFVNWNKLNLKVGSTYSFKNSLREMLRVPTVDNLLILANADNDMFHDDVIAMIKQLNPYDVEIIKEIVSLASSVNDIKGDSQAPIGTQDNSPYMRKSFCNTKSINSILNKNPDNVKNLLNHIISLPEQMLDANSIFDYVFENVDNFNDLNKWENYFLSYAEKFPSFINLKDINAKYLRLLPNIAKMMNTAIKDISVEDKLSLCLSAKNEGYWDGLSIFEKNVVLDKMSYNYKKISNEYNFMDYSEKFTYAKKLFYRDFESFKDDEILREVLYNKIYDIDISDFSNLTAEHVKFIFSSLSKNKYGMLEIPDCFKEIYKKVMIEDFPELVSREDVVKEIGLSEGERKKIYISLMDRDLHEINFNILIDMRNFKNKSNEETSLVDDLVQKVTTLPLSKQFIWMNILSKVFVSDKEDKLVVKALNRLGHSIDKGESVLINNCSNPIFFKLPALHDVERLLNDNDVLTDYQYFQEKISSVGVLFSESKISVDYGCVGLSNIENNFELNINNLLANKVNDINFDIALKAKDFNKMGLLFKVNKDLNVELSDQNIEALFSFIKSDTPVDNGFLKHLTKNIKESVLLERFSPENIETLICASNFVSSSFQYKNSFGLSESEIEIYSDVELKEILSAYAKIRAIENIFSENSDKYKFLDNSQENDNSFGFKI